MASDTLFRRSSLPVFQSVAVLLLTACFFATADTTKNSGEMLVNSETDMPYTHYLKGLRIKPGYELQIKGQNNSDSVLILIVRIDNNRSKNYYTRYNRQFSIQPGTFSLTVPMTGLKTSGKQPLTLPYTKMIIFTAGSSDDMVLTHARITPPPPRPKKVMALDFGREDSPVFPGFEPVTARDKRLSGALLQRFRPSGDALMQDGLEGIDSFSAPWENGQWKLTIWLQEQGEWEYLPHFMQRKVRVQGQTIVDESYNTSQWLSEVYFAGAKKEAVIDGDQWQLIGERRTRPVTSTVTITDNQFTIEWIGDRAARYAAGLVLEPLDGQFAADADKQRQARFMESWPATLPGFPRPQKLSISDESEQPSTNLETYKVYPTARNSLLNLNFRINSPEPDNHPVIAIANPRNSQGQKLALKSRYGHWRFERPHPNANRLVAADSYLRADLTRMTLTPELPRHLYLQVEIPPDTEPGIYTGSLQLLSKGALKVVEFAVDVMPVDLPDMKHSVGLYLEHAPFYEWFPEKRKLKSLAAACDLSLLRSMGFTNVAPSLETPVNEDHRKKLINQLKQIQQFGFQGPTLAYVPLKRLLSIQPDDEALQSLSSVRDAAAVSQLETPYWSIYDEPHPDRFSAIKDTAIKLHSQSLDMKTAGHLNNPRQKELLGITDLVILNHGFGVSKAVIEKLKKNSKVWLYNMPVPRLAAGFYLWKSNPDGYLQWHGRMPTADPFDPTDGREGDVIYLYPWLESCPDTMDIHKRLLDLHEATIDLRWLQWLETQAETSVDARNLVEKLRNAIPDNWDKAQESLSARQLIMMRKTIMELAGEVSLPE
ncbi:hypothetical protein [Endozoicomonas euniceicola]|uniref:Glycoside hydrolase 123 C-terminal domain-containing protein n=1 Tax=Endozoicomonas euniceicola TaxID=1234143 RepID=A0ABY6H107_9GAMM|nr:hypothetical protein [Endozoicomonas euniceicola]UYM17951.1 hypothetical protein NX720_08620 [Endozoicomonas euniceicola]